MSFNLIKIIKLCVVNYNENGNIIHIQIECFQKIRFTRLTILRDQF